MPEEQKVPRTLTWFPGAAAALAFIACNGTALLVAMLAAVGVTLVINPHLQAAAISVFALLTLGFVFLGYRKHRVMGHCCSPVSARCWSSVRCPSRLTRSLNRSDCWR